MTAAQCQACLLALFVLVWSILIFFGLGGTCQISGPLELKTLIDRKVN